MKFFAYLILITLSFNSLAQDCKDFWIGNFSNLDEDPIIDENENIYVWDNIDSEGKSYLVKYNKDGETLIKKEFLINSQYFKQGLAKHGNSIYLASSYTSIINKEDSITTPTGYPNAFLRKMDTTGHVLWDIFFDSNLGGELTSAVTDSWGNIYVSGSFQDTITLQNKQYWGPLTNSTNAWVGIFKFDPNGSLLWMKNSRGAGRIFEMEVDINGNLVFGGAFYNDSFTLSGITLLRNEYSGWRQILGKISPKGTLKWMTSIQSHEWTNIYDLTTSGEDVLFLNNFRNNIIIHGDIRNSRGREDGGIGRVDSKGNLKWFNTFGTTGNVNEGWGTIGLLTSGDVAVLTEFDNQEDKLFVKNDSAILIGSTSKYPESHFALLQYDKNNGVFTESTFLYGQFHGRAATIHENVLYASRTSRFLRSDENRSIGSFVKLNLTNPMLLEIRGNIVPSTLEENIGKSIALKANIGSGVTRINWMRNGEIIEGADSVAHFTSLPGVFELMLYDDEGCTYKGEDAVRLIFRDTSLERDSIILASFYDAFRGDLWVNSDNWKTGSIDQWYGVTVENDRVTKLQLPSNNMGVEYESYVDFKGLNSLKIIDLSNNQFSSLPDNLGTLDALEALDISSNKLNFNDLEALLPIIEALNYSHQKSTNSNICGTLNEPLTIGFLQGKEESTQYTWVKDGLGLDYTEASLLFELLESKNKGVYKQRTTHSDFPSLTLEEEFHLNIGMIHTEINLPKNVIWKAETQIIENSFGVPTSINSEVTISSLENGFYEVSDVSGGWYEIFGFNVNQGVQIGAKSNCNDVGYVILDNSASQFSISSAGNVSWDPNTSTLTIPWKDNVNQVLGETKFTISGSKQPQFISISLSDTAVVNESISLPALASSGLLISYHITDGLDIASIHNGVLNVDSPGIVKIVASQSGNNSFAKAREVQIELVVLPKKVEISLAKLIQKYDTKLKEVEITTNASDLTIDVTYNGSYEKVVDAGIYHLKVYAGNTNYRGFAEANLTIEKAEAIISIKDSIYEEYDGLPKEVLITTNPPDLNYEVFYNQGNNQPLNSGDYEVLIKIREDNYYGEKSAYLRINKALARIEIRDTVGTFDGQTKQVSIATEPPNLLYSIDYNSTNNLPIDAGLYPISVIIQDENYYGEKNSYLQINKANAEISILDTVHIYDGKSKQVSIYTNPANLKVIVLYNDQDLDPVDLGEYEVTVSVDEKNYVGNKTAKMLISQPLNLDPKDITLQAFPNPATHTLHVTGVVNGARLVLLDYSGKEFIKVTVPADQNNYHLDISSIPSGHYLMNYKSIDKLKSFHVIIQR
ncbi:MAG: hypothetical protein JXR10_00425 [Cyclobacteriaceae bacterium]